MRARGGGVPAGPTAPTNRGPPAGPAPRRRRGGGQAPRWRATRAEVAEAWARDGWAGWDGGFKRWRDFFAMKSVGAHVEQDLATGAVAATPIEAAGLSLPADRAEWTERLKSNAQYRKNYTLIAAGAVLASALAASPGAFAAALAGCAAAVVLRDGLLGSAALYLEERCRRPVLVWNAERVAGRPRQAVAGLLAGGALALLGASGAGPGLRAALRGLYWAALLIFAHASARPRSLSSVARTLVSDIKAAKSRKDLLGALKSSADGLQETVKNAAESAQNPFVVMTSFRNSGRPASGSPPPASDAPDEAEDAVDVDGREAPPERKRLP